MSEETYLVRVSESFFRELAEANGVSGIKVDWGMPQESVLQDPDAYCGCGCDRGYESVYYPTITRDAE